LGGRTSRRIESLAGLNPHNIEKKENRGQLGARDALKKQKDSEASIWMEAGYGTDPRARGGTQEWKFNKEKMLRVKKGLTREKY